MNEQIEQSNGVIAQLANKYSVSQDQMVAFLKQVAIKGSSNKIPNHVFFNFCTLALKYDLDPFAKEVTMFPTKAGYEVVVMVDGWSKIINSNKEFDGIEFQDHLDGDGNMLAITCKIFRKDRKHPTVITEYMAECRNDESSYSPWKRWPRRMLRHKAMIQCARIAFNISGIIDRDEYDRILVNEDPLDHQEEAMDTPKSKRLLDDLKGEDIVDAEFDDVENAEFKEVENAA